MRRGETRLGFARLGKREWWESGVEWSGVEVCANGVAFVVFNGGGNQARNLKFPLLFLLFFCFFSRDTWRMRLTWTSPSGPHMPVSPGPWTVSFVANGNCLRGPTSADVGPRWQ